MNFSDHIADFNFDDQRLSIMGKTAQDVERALAKKRLDLEDFKALISPAAEAYLEPMARRSQQLTRQRFGNTINLYVPLYLSNKCSNICTYCGFSLDNHIRRITLDMAQFERELDAIERLGYSQILLVTGEAHSVGMPYFREVMGRLRDRFAQISMEVQPLDEAEYAELIGLGLDAVLVYQETYNKAAYAQYHLRGNKQDFEYRLNTGDRLGRAGVRKIGLGSLIGLEDWRSDSLAVATHLRYLQKQYWKTKYSISFPRLRPCEGSFQPKSPMSERQLLQLICAYRLLEPDVELSLSTRESAHFRDNVMALGITTMSAASSTQPGGYADPEQRALEQFSINDERSVPEVAASIKAHGLEVVWKDWDTAFHR